MADALNILCGPLLRYIDRRSAVIFVELSQDAEIELSFAPLQEGFPVREMTSRAWPVQIGSTWYAWIKCGPLLPDTWYEYRISLRNPGDNWLEVWPDRELTGLSYPSRFQTLPLLSVSGTRISFGSCRAGFPPKDPKALEEGIDALHAYAEHLAKQVEYPDESWPHFFLLMGDQIYGDNISFQKRREFARRPENPVKSNHATTYAEYASLYREAWTTVGKTRWMLSCIPSFMIFDDHEITDDWNITEQWLQEKLQSPGWTRLMRDGLLAYWIYQGAGNLSPRQARTDERSRWLIPRYPGPFRDVTRRMTGLFESYIQRRRSADWGYTIDVPDARFVIGDTRMSRKLTGKRLLMDDTTWNRFATRAKDSRARKTFLVVPGPVLVGHSLHDLLSRVAESIEGNPPSVIGAIAGGLVGTLVAGPVGGLVGAIAGGLGSEYLLDKYGEDLIREADIELWAAFPSSFNRMLTLLEHLQDGVGTRPRKFIGILAGDVHHSNIFRGDFRKTSRAGSVLHLTMSPLQRHVGDDDKDLLRDLEGGTWYIDAANSLERPGFVKEQRRRLNWYPLDMNGNPANREDDDSWNLFGKFIGELTLDTWSVTYRYQKAQLLNGQLSLEELTNQRILTF